MRRSKKVFRDRVKEIIEDALQEAEKPTLANPALATHSLVMFAIEHSDLFTEWLNEGATETVPAVTSDEVRDRLADLHKLIDVAVASLPAEAILADAPPGIRVMRARPPIVPDDRYPGPYL